MATTTNARQLAALNRQRARALVRNCQDALEKSENAIHWEAQTRSMGNVSTAALSAAPPGLNHPYGYGRSNRRGPRGPVPNGGDLSRINAQTGNFAVHWDANGFFTVSRMVIVLSNDAPYAGAMLGTSTMRERPILQAVEQAQWPAFVRRFREAKTRALQQ